jgi:hypothetical protein
MYKRELTVVLSQQGPERARKWNRSLEELKVDTLKRKEFALGEEPTELIEDIAEDISRRFEIEEAEEEERDYDSDYLADID